LTIRKETPVKRLYVRLFIILRGRLQTFTKCLRDNRIGFTLTEYVFSSEDGRFNCAIPQKSGVSGENK
jgi:hypothetical protein